MTSTAGTYTFLSPECCDPESQSFSGKAADIWAVGVTFFAMTFNQLPFYAESEIKLFETIKDT